MSPEAAERMPATTEDGQPGGTGGGEPGESEKERLDRNLIELLNELRVAITGVQVLFAFLLTVPFQQRFTEVSAFQEKVYFGILACTALASIFLIAPTVHHRLEFRQHDKAHILKISNRFAVAGLSFLALAISGVVLLITNLLFEELAAVVTTAAVVAILALVWYGIPLRRRQLAA